LAEATLAVAFIAGLVSFLAPCVIPLVPAFLGYLAGASVEKASRWALFGHSALFVLGFGTIFAVLGVLLNSVLTNVAYAAQVWIGRIAGVIIILFGLYLVGLLKFKFLQSEHKFRVHRFRSKALTSFVFGAAFAAGWTPCVGAVLGSILALAASMPGESFALLLAYSLGLGIPFLVAGFFAKEVMGWLQRDSKWLKYFNIVVGAVIILLGVLVFTGKLAAVAGTFSFLNVFLLE
jgi:cytochrome c-type biogenesis protein